MMNEIPVSIVILTGGKSRRLGKDKTNLKFGDKLLPEFVYESLKHLSDDILFSGNSGFIAPDNTRVISDIVPGRGPLSGIHSALHESRYDHCFVTACDTPFISPALVELLYSNSSGFDIAIPEWQDLIEPLTSLYSKECIPIVEKMLEDETYSLRTLIKRANTRIINIDESFTGAELEKMFLNINTDKDYRRAFELLERDKKNPGFEPGL